MNKKKGCDIAKWNPINDYAAMKADGIEFCIPKAINKSLKKDSLFETHVKGCMDAGIVLPGTYHYTYATDEQKARESAKAWLYACAGRFKRFYLDWEDASLPKTAEAIDIISAYADALRAAGYEMYLYTGMSYYNSYFKRYADRLPYGIWIARYYRGYTVFRPSYQPEEKYLPDCPNVVGWQYTSSGQVNGASGNIDLDLWYEDIPASGEAKTVSEITAEINPYAEPTASVKRGNRGDGVRWVQWYLWRFGLLLDEDGNADSSEIDGIFGVKTEAAVKQSQQILGTTPDGVVGKVTRTLYKKIC